MGHAVAHLVDSRWCHWKFSLTSFRSHDGPGVDSASNRNEYQEYFLGGKGGCCVGLTTLPSSYTDCLEILGASTSWNPQGLSRSVMGLLHHYRRLISSTEVKNEWWSHASTPPMPSWLAQLLLILRFSASN